MTNITTSDDGAGQGRMGRLLLSRPWLWRSILYTVLFLCATSVFIITRFPEEVLASIVNQALEKAPMEMQAHRAELTFPLGLTLFDLSVDEKADPENRIMSISSLRVKPYILAAISGNRKAWVEANSLGGAIEGVVATDGLDGDELEVELDFNHIDPGKGEWWGRFPWFKAEGIFEGQGAIKINRNDWTTAQGRLESRIKEAKLILGKSLNSKGGYIDISEGEIELKLEKGNLSVVKGAFSGPHASLVLSGAVTMAKNPQFSMMNIIITMKLSETAKQALGTAAYFLPQPDSSGKIVMKIGGTFRSPIMR
ncbi:MAG: type II secretion system protein GspN [Nitrospinota bacterium]|nr:type II secretion system protein GspN [Nitrospinota bacterium]